MRPLSTAGAAIAFIASFILMRIVLHGYADHGHLDVLHLAVTIGSAAAGVILVRRALRPGAAPPE